MKTFFTSDLHFFHDNIIIYCKRPCTPEEHNDWIIETINKQVSPGDVVYHLGDLTGTRSGFKFKDLVDIFSRLNGTWKCLKGNHDNENQMKALMAATGNEYLGSEHEFKILGRTFVLYHFPIESWHKKSYSSIHLHGHTHDTVMRPIPNRFSVCLDLEQKVYLLEDIIDQSVVYKRN